MGGASCVLPHPNRKNKNAARVGHPDESKGLAAIAASVLPLFCVYHNAGGRARVRLAGSKTEGASRRYSESGFQKRRSRNTA
jgi:hypothetical protein